MRALRFDSFGGRPYVHDEPDPVAAADGAVIRVEATGLCRSDWHGWQGHDPDIALPHVPGHEFAGVVDAVGSAVLRFQPGDRVTVPFVCACGRCGPCLAGDQQVCDDQVQPGFTQWGSFADLVRIDRADLNLIAVPDAMSSVTAAALGCRFATAYRAVRSQGDVRPGQWVAVLGCGGVGLSAVMIAVAAGAQVVAVDVVPEALRLARDLGAAAEVAALPGPGAAERVAAEIRSITGGGAHLGIDALGSADTCLASILGLRKRGRHVQVGLLPPQNGRPAVPMDQVVARALEVVGSHGMAAHAYPAMLAEIASGLLRPDRLVTRTIGLDDAADALIALSAGTEPGVTVIVPGLHRQDPLHQGAP